jgi:serine/threonine protein kinase
MAVAPIHAESPHKVVASGGFGVVVKPAFPNEVNGIEHEFPGNVTKIFYEEAGLRNALAKANEISHIMNDQLPEKRNEGHNAFPYVKQYRFANIPENIQPNIAEAFGRDVGSNEPLHLMRMHNLGVDIFTLNEDPSIIDKLRNVPFVDIFYQFYKLFNQTDALGKHEYVHFDIRETNVMIQPDTGVMTIIDFDLMKPFHERHELFVSGQSSIKYQHPPECFMYHNMEKVENPEISMDVEQFMYTDAASDGERNQARIRMMLKYCRDSLMYFNKVFAEFGIHTLDELYHAIGTANTQNVEYIRELVQAVQSDIFYNKVLKSIDNYGLSLTLLQLLGHLYPNVVRYGKEIISIKTDPFMNKAIKDRTLLESVARSKEELKAQLPSLIRNAGKPYTPNQIELISNALLHLSAALNTNASFGLKHRLPAFAIMKHIGNRFIHLAEELNKEPALAGGRRRRRTQNRRHKRKFNTRNKRR